MRNVRLRADGILEIVRDDSVLWAGSPDNLGEYNKNEDLDLYDAEMDYVQVDQDGETHGNRTERRSNIGTT